jgi:DNA-binding transcriptional LysR family regulator
MSEKMEAIRARKNLVTLKEKLTRETWNDRDGEIVLTVDDALSALRQWLADEGLVVVPGEATEEQIKEAMLFRSLNERPPHVHNTAGLYRAMLSAAPDALEQEAE